MFRNNAFQVTLYKCLTNIFKSKYTALFVSLLRIHYKVYEKRGGNFSNCNSLMSCLHHLQWTSVPICTAINSKKLSPYKHGWKDRVSESTCHRCIKLPRKTSVCEWEKDESEVVGETHLSCGDGLCEIWRTHINRLVNGLKGLLCLLNLGSLNVISFYMNWCLKKQNMTMIFYLVIISPNSSLPSHRRYSRWFTEIW